MKIAIVDSDSSLDFESNRNRQSKLAVLESKSSTIRFVSPNRISLVTLLFDMVGLKIDKKAYVSSITHS